MSESPTNILVGKGSSAPKLEKIVLKRKAIKEETVHRIIELIETNKLEMSVRVSNVLKHLAPEYEYVEHLNKAILHQQRNFGLKSINEIEKLMKTNNISLENFNYGDNRKK